MATIKRFTAGIVTGFRCPKEKDQVFLWVREKPPGLGFACQRASGCESVCVPEPSFSGRTTAHDHRQPGGVKHRPTRRKKAKELQRQIDDGLDPREVKAEAIKAAVAKRSADAANVLTVADVWPIYMAEGKPRKKDAWKPRYVADLHKQPRLAAIRRNAVRAR